MIDKLTTLIESKKNGKEFNSEEFAKLIANNIALDFNVKIRVIDILQDMKQKQVDLIFDLFSNNEEILQKLEEDEKKKLIEARKYDLPLLVEHYFGNFN